MNERLSRAAISRLYVLSKLVLAFAAVMNLGCASYRGAAKDAEPAKLFSQGSWISVRDFPRVLQTGDRDCGAAALAAVARFWGYPSSPEQVTASVGKKGERLRAADIERYARSLGLASYVFYGNLGDVLHELDNGRPVIVGVGKPIREDKAIAHYEVVIGYEPQQRRVLLLDPARGFQVNSFEGFAKEWSYSKGVTIVAFAPEPAVKG